MISKAAVPTTSASTAMTCQAASLGATTAVVELPDLRLLLGNVPTPSSKDEDRDGGFVTTPKRSCSQEKLVFMKLYEPFMN
jgi:hypothetical protein